MKRNLYREKIKRHEVGGVVAPQPTFMEEAVDEGANYVQDGRQYLNDLYGGIQQELPKRQAELQGAIGRGTATAGQFVDNTLDAFGGIYEDAKGLFKDSYESQLRRQQAKEQSAQAYETIKQDFAILAQHLYEQGDQAAIEFLSRTWDKIDAVTQKAMEFERGGKIEPVKQYDGQYVALVGQKPYYFTEDKEPVREINLSAEQFPKTLEPIDKYKKILDGEPSVGS